jgi:hypothetical protein
VSDGGLFTPDSPIYYGVICVFLVSVLSLIFFFRSDVKFWLVVSAAPLSFVPGVLLFVFERYLQKLQNRLETSAGRVQAGFLILFAFLLGYIIISTLSFIYPMGFLIDLFANQMIRDQYGSWIINLAIVASLASWLRCQLRAGKN